MIGVYKLTNKFNRKVYVGKSIDIEKRYRTHILKANQTKYKKLVIDEVINRIGIESFDFDILIECPKENLDYWEKFYIRYYCSNNPDFGYNKTSGGTGGFTGINSGCFCKGHKRNLGKNLSEKHIHSLSESHKGYHWYTDPITNKRIFYRDE